MEVTLESIQKNKELYNENMQKLLQERADLMKKVADLRRKRDSLEDSLEIAKLDFEESNLIQQINDITYTYKGNKLTLEQLGLQEDVLETKIDRQAYSDGMVANRTAKADLSKEQEVTYCENEVTKCEKALELYILMGDSDSITKWKQALENAQNDLTLARQELAKDQKSHLDKNDKQEQQTAPTHIDEYGENIKSDNIQEEELTEGHLAGYSYEEKDGVFTEVFNQVLKDDSGKEIGSRTITEVEKIGEKRTIKTVGEIENDDGKYSIKEISEVMGEEYSVLKEIKGSNKLTGNSEQFNYSKDKMGNEFAYSMINGKINLRVSRTNRGTTIERYDENGNIQDTFEYDKDGKAIDGFQGIDEIQEDYVENFFKKITRNVPEYYAEGMDKPISAKENENFLESAVKATEETTRTSIINEQVQLIKNMQRERTQQQDKENNGLNR